MVLTIELILSVLGFRFFPTRNNRKCCRLEKEIRKSVRHVIEAWERVDDIENSGSYGSGMLGVMMPSKLNK